MQPSKQEFEEWQGHPVTEWIFRLVGKFASDQQDRWAKMTWESGELQPEAFAEARVRADCYLSLSQSGFEDWKAIDDTES